MFHRMSKTKSELDAGPELDALVAVKVMQTHEYWERPSDDPRDWARLVQLDNGALRGLDQIPNYSTDIEAAWQVIEHLHRSLPFDCGVKVTHGGSDGAWCEIYDTSPMGYVSSDGRSIPARPDIALHASTVPLAICLAALAAVSE